MEDTTKYDYNKPLPSDFANLNFNYQLSAAKFDSVKDLLTTIPPELFGKNNTHFGSYFPDAGYTDVRTTVNGVAYEWGFEADQSTSSPAIRQFVQRLTANFNFSFILIVVSAYFAKGGSWVLTIYSVNI